MNLVRIVCVLLSSAFLMACASKPAIIVPDAEGKEPISAINMTCGKPYELVNDCSGFSGPKKKINISGVDMKVASTADGKIIAMFGGKNKGSRGGTSNIGYEVVKRELAEDDIEIINVTPVISLSQLFGYVIETDQPAYELIIQSSEQ